MVTETNLKYKILNRDIIKYIAMLTMLLNHISTIFMEPKTILAELFLDIGYFTAIVMCYFLVEGYHYTHSKKRYAFRLFIFALISELPYCMAFTEAFTGNDTLSFCGLNMLFTLLICFGILAAIEKVSNKFLKIIVIIGLILLSIISDWALLAPIFTLLFVWADGSKRKITVSFLISMLLFGLLNFVNSLGYVAPSTNLLYSLESMAGIAVAGIVIMYLYNGKRMEKGRNFSKWFFYLFYPAHLLVLGLI